MKNKISQLLKRFNAWLIRASEWLNHPSPLSLLITLLIPAFSFGLVCLYAYAFPDYLLSLHDSFFDEGFTYSEWLCLIVVFVVSFWLFFSCWFADLIKYIISLFRKSSAPADDK